jgi:acetyl esterase/lipase
MAATLADQATGDEPVDGPEMAKKPMRSMNISTVARIGMTRVAVAVGLVTALLSGCSPTALLDTLTPAGDYELRSQIAYGTRDRQALDVYRPRETGPARPVIVFFYGGSWRGGEKAQYRFVAEALTRQGFVVVIPNYRVYPDVSFPGFIEDGALAVRWSRDHVAAFGGDPARLFVMGHSAGGHIAMMVGLAGRYLDAVGVSKKEIAGLIGIAGPYDFLPSEQRRVQEVFASARDLDEAQPMIYADRSAPPVLLLHGTADRTVYPRNSERLAAKLREAGAPVRLELYPQLGHYEIMLGLSSVLGNGSRLMSDIVAFTEGRGATAALSAGSPISD